ncbi:MAG TPA: DUF4976 domain-containing protein, partial [Planctomycetaceae bacterium]|nr:DUF4976 domain-containing protein [Planctomycetaceae bacterium]
KSADIPLDGDSIVPELKGQKSLATRPLAWHYPHYHGSEWTPGAAIRDGDWKLIEFYEFGDAELYDLAKDPGEHHNLASEEPTRVNALRKKLSNWQTTLHASMPQPNPAWKSE